MTDKEKKIIELRDEGLTFEKIGSEVGLSGQRARQVYRNALRRKRYIDETGFPEDMPASISNSLRRAGIRDIHELIEFVERGGDISKVRKIGKKGEEYIREMLRDECEINI